MMLKRTLAVALTIGAVFGYSLTNPAQAQTIDSAQTATPTIVAVQQAPTPEKPKKKSWFDIISIRGYAQIRYNRLLETNDQLKCEQCDRSLGENGGLFIRRARLIFSGNVTDRISFYIQPDLASSASSTSLNFLQLRDAYFDVAIDKEKEFRFRIGQSKIPFGFENLQSSSNRITLDRNDALNSAVANERDLGVFFYWAPAIIRERFKMLTDEGLKGSGDYGVFGIGIFNGQTANKPEANNSQHVVARLSYPFQIGNKQIIEPGLQAYTGKYTVTPDQLSTGVTIPTAGQVKDGFTDERIAATLVVYPQPLGFQAEYNIGRGPEFDPATSTIKVKDLHGGYAQTMYRIELDEQVIMPFVKVQYYDGGKKHERDAASYTVYETELGVEWVLFKGLELTADYSIADRTVRNAANLDNRQHGNRLRLQAQFSF